MHSMLKYSKLLYHACIFTTCFYVRIQLYSKRFRKLMLRRHCFSICGSLCLLISFTVLWIVKCWRSRKFWIYFSLVLVTISAFLIYAFDLILLEVNIIHRIPHISYHFHAYLLRCCRGLDVVNCTVHISMITLRRTLAISECINSSGFVLSNILFFLQVEV